MDSTFNLDNYGYEADFKNGCSLSCLYLLQAACIAVSIMLHYLFLVVFMWMLMEGVFLYIQLHPNKNINMKMLICAGIAWGEFLLTRFYM